MTEQSHDTDSLDSKKRSASTSALDTGDMFHLHGRSKLACERCRKRKTKCSGLQPCRSCEKTNQDCVYPRKAKKVPILDTEVEAYEEEIRRLKKELSFYRSKPNPQPEGGDTKIDLSIWLGSASSELICWNLQQFAKSNTITRNGFTISPDFSSFIEETAYDHYLNQHETFNDVSPLLRLLSELTYSRVMELLDNVVLFLNSGYLTVNPGDFRSQVQKYFKPDGSFDINSVSNTSEDYFLFKVLMVLSLGEIYSRSAAMGPSCTTIQTGVPGIKYFQLVIQYIPPIFRLFSLAKENLDDTLQVIELFGLVAMYLRCMDKKQLAVMFTLNAMEMGVAINLHKKSEEQNNHHRKVWWAIYCLNRFFSSRTGQPLLLDHSEITRSYPSVKNSIDVPPESKDAYSNADTMTFYIELAVISEVITKELYSLKEPFDTKQYLKSTLRILEMLVDWVDNIPDYLKLELPTNENFKKYNENNRLVYTLHLNYLHHIYLTCVPIVLNFAKARLLSYKKDNLQTSLDLNGLPRNITKLIMSCINAAQLTINMFIAIYRENLLRTFGFTDLDYLLSSCLVFIICLILNIKLPQTSEFHTYSFEEYLEVAMNVIYEMKVRGNLVAKGKLVQIIDLLLSLKNLFTDLGYTRIYTNLDKYTADYKLDVTSMSILSKSKTASPLVPASIAVKNREVTPENDFTFQSMSTPPLDTGVNHILATFQLGRDGLDHGFLTGPAIINDDLEKQDYLLPYSDLFKVTDEDILFMDQMALDFHQMG